MIADGQTCPSDDAIVPNHIEHPQKLATEMTGACSHRRDAPQRMGHGHRQGDNLPEPREVTCPSQGTVCSVWQCGSGSSGNQAAGLCAVTRVAPCTRPSRAPTGKKAAPRLKRAALTPFHHRAHQSEIADSVVREAQAPGPWALQPNALRFTGCHVQTTVFQRVRAWRLQRGACAVIQLRWGESHRGPRSLRLHLCPGTHHPAQAAMWSNGQRVHRLPCCAQWGVVWCSNCSWHWGPSVVGVAVGVVLFPFWIRIPERTSERQRSPATRGTVGTVPRLGATGPGD